MDTEKLGKAAPYVRRLVRELDLQSALPMLLSCFVKFESGDFERVVKWLLVFVTRYSIIANLDSSGLETVLFKLARDIRSQMTQPKAAKASLANIKTTLSLNAPPDAQVKIAVANLILSSDEAKYVLGRLATHMQTATKEVTINEANVEHIFPKNPGNEWTNKSDLEQYLWHIGNLTILGERLNRDAANRGFSFKRTNYYAKSELAMALKIANDYKTWDNTTIEDRAKKLAPLIAEIWNFDNPSRV